MPAGQGPSGPGAGVRQADASLPAAPLHGAVCPAHGGAHCAFPAGSTLFSAPGAPVYARQLKQGHNARSMPGLKGGAAPGRPCGGEHRGKFQKKCKTAGNACRCRKAAQLSARPGDQKGMGSKQKSCKKRKQAKKRLREAHSLAVRLPCCFFEKSVQARENFGGLTSLDGAVRWKLPSS